ncbi:sulfotransferase family protein [Streptomyces sp. NPDC092370]|uniref:sulfotransferase-like domain-containing protein n=1 Tax=Streptomyces sp. NPDC092370 TaxID=3366016 RepID=UPI00382B7957
MKEFRADGGPDHLLLALWSAPRSRSTAFERMMMERGDFDVVHEPFSHVADFGSAEVAGRTVASETELIEALRAVPGRVFFKDTTDFHYPALLADTDFLTSATHTFIIRDPAEVIASHAALNPRLTRDEIGFSRLYEIYNAVVAATGTEPVVIDSDDLLDRPEATVRAYCERVGIPFQAAALHWEPGVPPQWQRTEKWHRDASKSSTFTRRSTEDTGAGVADDPVLGEFHRFHLPYYMKLREQRLAV